MKTHPLAAALFPLVLGTDLWAQPPAPEPPVPVYQAPMPPPPAPPAPENQRLYGPTGPATLVSPEAAHALLDRFHAAYGSPRIALAVNRDLVDAHAGFQLTHRTENFSTTTGSGPATTTTTGQNVYDAKPAATTTLADRQTVRDIERLFGRVFRNGGAALADPQIAAAMMTDHPGSLLGDPSIRDREALAHVADIVVEVLISTRNVVVPGSENGQTVMVPDIQATAIRLKDAVIIGQASASDVLGKDYQSARIVRQFGPPDIIEATALALVEDMLTGQPNAAK